MSRIFKTKNLMRKHLGLAILGKKQMDFHTDLLENKYSEARVSILFFFFQMKRVNVPLSFISFRS